MEYGYASEHSTLDAQQCRMTVRTRNLVLSRFISIEERLEYSRLPSDSSKTLIEQEVTIRVQKLLLSDYIETIIGKTLNTNTTKVGEEKLQQDIKFHLSFTRLQDRQGIEWTIDRMRTPVIAAE